MSVNALLQAGVSDQRTKRSHTNPYNQGTLFLEDVLSWCNVFLLSPKAKYQPWEELISRDHGSYVTEAC